jgi:anaerobic selenocysteine-containing dehydrogenase
MGYLPEEELAPLRAALEEGGRLGLAAEYFDLYGVSTSVDDLKMGPLALYEVLGPTLPHGAKAAAVLWAAAHAVAFQHEEAVRRAGFEGDGPDLGEALFDAIIGSRSGVVFTADDYEDTWNYLGTFDEKVHLVIPELLDELDGLRHEAPPAADDEFPFVLTCGSRRAFSANTILRNPDWRKTDRDGALHISPLDAAALGVTDGAKVAVTTKRGRAEALVEISDAMQPGHVILPNGYGLSYPDENGKPVVVGVAPNELTASEDRDWFAGTPWHKHVRARVEPVVS